jgi:hypothetical protein
MQLNILSQIIINIIIVIIIIYFFVKQSYEYIQIFYDDEKWLSTAMWTKNYLNENKTTKKEDKRMKDESESMQIEKEGNFSSLQRNTRN